MSKVLISFIGTGRPKNNGAERVYRSASYRFSGDPQTYSTSFVADAIIQHSQADRVILLGTAKSMWEEVYRAFVEKKGDVVDEDIYCSIADYCDSQNKDSAPIIPNKDVIETAIGEDSHIEIIKYGLTKDELDYNASLILSLEKYLHKGDEIIVDITHSFRSLPIYIMNLLIYLENVNSKKITISHIYYGMLDIQSEMNGITPVIELDNILTLNKWIIAAYSLKSFGDASLLSSLLPFNSNVSVVLKRFSDSLNLNDLKTIKTISPQMVAIGGDLDELAKMVVAPIIERFSTEFTANAQQSKNQFNLCKWHFDHFNYLSAYNCLIESIVSYVCENMGSLYDENNIEHRELAKYLLGKQENAHYKKKYKEFFETKNILLQIIPKLDVLDEVYNNTNDKRNYLVHLTSQKYSVTELISTLESSIRKLRPLFL